MPTVLQVHHQSISTEDLLPLLSRYQLLEDLLREIVIDQAIAPIHLTDEALAGVGAGESDRPLKIQTFKQQRWNASLSSYFLERSAQLDRVIYSMIRVQNPGIADELYFRIQANEQSFGELATQYSQGTEAETRGLVGPVELGAYHPQFAQILATAPPGELLPPLALENCFVILRVEKRLSARLDDAIRQRLLDERFEQWLQGEVKQLRPQTTSDLL